MSAVDKIMIISCMIALGFVAYISYDLSKQVHTIKVTYSQKHLVLGEIQ